MAIIGYSAIYLMFVSLRIMRTHAIKSGKTKGTRDICKIFTAGILLVATTSTRIVSFIILAVLEIKKYGPFGQEIGQREAWTCVCTTISVILLFVANLILLNLFWGYVINVNETIKDL